MVSCRVLVIVDDLDGLRSLGSPSEANTELPVDSDTVLSAAISLESLELIAWGHPNRVERHRRIELVQFPSCDRPERVGATAPSSTRVGAVEDILGAATAE